MKNLITTLGVAVILSAAAHTAAAVTVTPGGDAFDLASGFTSANPAATGDFIETSGTHQVGTFTDGDLTIGIVSGIVLSTGNVAGINPLASFPPYLSTDYSGSPGASTAALVDQISAFGTPFADFDTVRFSMTVTPGLGDDYVNFRLGYLTSEISPADVFGIYVDEVFTGYVGGAAIDQAHPWMQAASSGIGFSHAFFLDGLATNPESLIVSLAIPNPGSAFQLDFVLVDAFDGNTDTAVFLGDFSLSSSALGTVAIPEPGTVGLFTAAGLFLVLFRKRARRSSV
ncbi:MAG: choice-of-anchor L domain-containing protein [Terrimicrobiaceae bacterium]|nr:choice-of-anchor L domain-containing protein [Terrimicrobiaceae bacterium]